MVWLIESYLLSTLLLLVLPVFSAFTIDDANATITYLPKPVPPPTGIDFGVNHNWTYYAPSVFPSASNNTLTVGNCWTDDGCTMTFSFAGSGINLYAYIGGNFNASVTIDNEAPINIEQTQCTNSPISACYLSIFATQGIPYGLHKITVTVLDYVTPTALVNSILMFDYARVNDTVNTLPTTTSSSASQSSSATTTSGSASATAIVALTKPTPVGAIAGGTVGGVAALLLLAFYLWRRHQRAKEDEGDRPRPPGALDETQYIAEPFVYQPSQTGATWSPEYKGSLIPNRPDQLPSSPRALSGYAGSEPWAQGSNSGRSAPGDEFTDNQIAPIVAQVIQSLRNNASPPAYAG